MLQEHFNGICLMTPFMFYEMSVQLMGMYGRNRAVLTLFFINNQLQ